MTNEMLRWYVLGALHRYDSQHTRGEFSSRDGARLYPSTDADLSNLVCTTDKGPDLLAADKCELSPAFDPDIKEYFS
eukprot:COSAG02_NODE_55115_length_292_cov_0.818653_1_plen_76_part_01